MRRGALVVAMFVCGAGVLSAQTMDVTLLEKKRITTIYPSRSSEATTGQSGDADASPAADRGRALPVPDTTSSGSTAQAAPRTFTVTGATLRLQLPDGRILEVVCTDKGATQLSSQGGQACLIPNEGPLQAKFRGTNVTLTWRVAKKKRSEVYSVLPLTLPLTSAEPPHS